MDSTRPSRIATSALRRGAPVPSTSATSLIRRSSTDLSADVETSLREAFEKEPAGSTPANTFDAILKNVEMARELQTPICQDTGAPLFYVYHPKGMDTAEFRQAAEAAAEKATKALLLRPNAVDPVTGKNSGTNVGIVNDAGFVKCPKGTMLIAVYCQGVAEEVQGEAVIAELTARALAVTGLG